MKSDGAVAFSLSPDKYGSQQQMLPAIFIGSNAWCGSPLFLPEGQAVYDIYEE
jgi:hypothetical protein